MRGLGAELVISGGGTAANEPCHCGGIVFPLTHCFLALLIVPRLPPRPRANGTGPKNNTARNYFSIDETPPPPTCWNADRDCTKRHNNAEWRGIRVEIIATGGDSWMDTTVEYMIENGMSAKVSEKSKERIFESISLFFFVGSLRLVLLWDRRS